MDIDVCLIDGAVEGYSVPVRGGQDLILEVRGPSPFDNGSGGSEPGALLNTVRLTDQFLGELNPYTTKGKQFQSGVNQIVFSYDVIWDRFRMAMQVADPRNTNDVYAGSGSGDVLWGGKGNDVMTGGLGGDIYIFQYIFQRGDGQDVISERGGFSFGLGAVHKGWRRGVVRRRHLAAAIDNWARVGCRAEVRAGNDEREAA